MFEEGRPCVDLAQQFDAVESAVSNAKRELIHDHIEHCLDGPDADTKSARRELKQLASMTFSPEFLLIVSVGVVGVLHTIVPDHWVPITLIARQRGWSKSETVSQHNCHLRRALRHLDGRLAARQSRRVRALWRSAERSIHRPCR